jgi:hypothetical protein
MQIMKTPLSPQMRFSPMLLILSLSGALACPSALHAQDSDVDELIQWLLEDDRDLAGVPFSAVVKATAGKKIIPLEPAKTTDRELLKKIEQAVGATMALMNEPDGPAHKQRRINEVSAHFEKALRNALNEIPGFECDYPKTASGRIQRSGYPDLRLVVESTGRVVYLDPKLFNQSGRTSSFRTFYFTPKKETNKILDDAHHLIVGFAHDGKHDGLWKFVGWEIVDLSRFKVRLKAEFQGSNRDLYQEETVVGTSESAKKSGRKTKSPADFGLPGFG